MPHPFVAYLRVYEPLSTFDPPRVTALKARLAAGPLARASAGAREQELWLRSQLTSPARLLPGERSGGRPLPEATLDVLVLDPAEVPTSDTATVGSGPLVCPLDLRPRAAAALAGFLATHGPPLREAALGASGVSLRDATERVNTVMSELDGASVHVISSTWTVPLPWFALIAPGDRRIVPAAEGAAESEEGTTPPLPEVCWRSPMADVRRRAARAYSVTKETMGEDGPAAVLRDTGRWLENFHPHSVVELDYGGLVQLLSAAELAADTSAEDVTAIVDAMEAGDATEITQRYRRLREFWAKLAARERFN